MLVAGGMLFVCLALGLLTYRGPAPLGTDASGNVPSAGRMRQDLNVLLGDPPLQHSAGTIEGEAFLDRLERMLADRGAETKRIEIPFDLSKQDWHPSSRISLLPDDTTLKNLLASYPGTDPSLAPILIATHHDSCPWGPGAGDAGSAIVAMTEYARILGRNPPQRTTHFLFTDGEEFGLLGAHALYAHKALAISEPAFVLNFDARGTRGGVPMFETYQGNRAAVTTLINELAYPKITTSLAVLIYRSLPNATDFDVFQGNFGWAGFNFATIGGAEYYHTPQDVPANLSDRTLQHMGNHVASMHLALDPLSEEQLATFNGDDARRDAVFFDVFGIYVITIEPMTQLLLAAFSLCLIGLKTIRSSKARILRSIPRLFGLAVLVILASAIIGGISLLVLKMTPYRNLRYTPVDLQAGLVTVLLALIGTTLLVDKLLSRLFPTDTDLDFVAAVWLATSLLATIVAWLIPAGGYLLVFPSLIYAVAVNLPRLERLAAWLGWMSFCILLGPTLVLLVQAIGPWNQPIYAAIAGLLTIPMAAAWIGGQADRSIDNAVKSKVLAEAT